MIPIYENVSFVFMMFFKIYVNVNSSYKLICIIIDVKKNSKNVISK